MPTRKQCHDAALTFTVHSINNTAATHLKPQVHALRQINHNSDDPENHRQYRKNRRWHAHHQITWSQWLQFPYLAWLQRLLLRSHQAGSSRSAPGQQVRTTTMSSRVQPCYRHLMRNPTARTAIRRQCLRLATQVFAAGPVAAATATPLISAGWQQLNCPRKSRPYNHNGLRKPTGTLQRGPKFWSMTKCHKRHNELC